VNLDWLRRENVLGKASRSKVEDILAVFRQRFVGEESVIKALVVLTRKRLPAAHSTATPGVFIEAFVALPSMAPHTATIMVAGNGIAALTAT
jgi:hypothetical protein